MFCLTQPNTDNEMKKDDEYKRFLVFEYLCYYPEGGMSDCSYSSDLEKDALNYAKNSDSDFCEVFDCDKREIIFERVVWNKAYLQ